MKTIDWKYPDMRTEEIGKQQVAELVKRYPKFPDMEQRCKCCASCTKWNVDRSLENRYEYNTCEAIGNAVMTKCCWVCDEYAGDRTEDNIPVYHIMIITR